ncbi:MAG: hypothetical protein EBV84_15195, partial [Betaproteobacteria bacterium]|nr:hypothetical protein [Betaproteobacteria bacterium]
MLPPDCLLEQPGRQRFFSLFQAAPFGTARKILSLGRTLQEGVLETLPPSTFFQDANYHDQIVKERREPTAFRRA